MVNSPRVPNKSARDIRTVNSQRNLHNQRKQTLESQMCRQVFPGNKYLLRQNTTNKLRLETDQLNLNY